MTRLIYYLTSFLLLIQISFSFGASRRVDIYQDQSLSKMIDKEKLHFPIIYVANGDSISWNIEVEVLKKATCFGINDGVARVKINGREQSYTFQWDHLSPTKDPICKNMTSGLHVVTVLAPNGEMVKDSVYIGMKYQINAEVKVISDAFSRDTPNGIAEVKLHNDQQGSFAFEWDTSPRQFSPVARNLAPGMYTVMIRDHRGCETMEAVSIVDQSIDLEDTYSSEFLLSSTESVSLFPFLSIKVFPNPNQGKFSIYSSKSMDRSQLELYNAKGELIYKQRNLKGLYHSMELKDVPSGIYFLRVFNEERKFVSKQILIN